ncbi:MAG: IS607 family transposase [Thermaerobacter sp.]|nr:IS607 family transposase [Thermaerobacter sp.]
MKDVFSPKEFGQLIGRTTGTLQRWDRKGILKAKRTPTNRRYYTWEDYLQATGRKPTRRLTATYCRVSSAGQKKDLQSQREAVEQFCTASGRQVDLRLEDVGSGLDYQRKRFVEIMRRVEAGEIKEIVMAHKDRLVRFGYEWFEAFCRSHGTEIIVMNAQSLSPEEEMVKDLLSIVHCFSSRLYGLRRYKKSIVAMIKNEEVAVR